jgi:WD40 repeat protein
VGTGRLLAELNEGDAFAEFSPDGSRLVTGSLREYRCWKTADWQEDKDWKAIPRDRADRRGPLVFTADGSVLAVAPSRTKVQLFDVTGAAPRELATLTPPEPEIVVQLRFSRDGGQLAVGTERGAVHLWDLRRIRERLSAMNLDWDLPAYSAAPPPLPGLKVQLVK